MKKFALLFHSVRHTRLRQLYWRLRLKLRRFRNTRFSARLKKCEARVRDRGLLPQPVFLPRQHLVSQQGELTTLKFLNLRIDFSPPYDWRPVQGRRALEAMNLHYMEYLEGVDDDTFCRIVDSWIENNPPFQPGYWLDNWNSYSVSIRCLVWMQQFARRQQSFSEPFKIRLIDSVRDQIRFLESNLELDICGNHLVKNIKTLVWASQFFCGEDADRWGRLAGDLLKRELAEQILGDGTHFERSPAYHAQVFADLLECYAVMPAELAEEIGPALKSMAQALVDLTHSDGLVSLFNDGGLHMAYSTSECISVFERLTGETVVPAARVLLPDAGYFGLRQGQNLLLVDCGKIAPDYLPAHGHGDILAFEWDFAGQRIAVDAGVYEYYPGPDRDYSRSTSSHNTVTVDDEDQCEFWLSFRVGRRANVQLNSCSIEDGKLQLDGSHDGYTRLDGRPVHRRTVESDTVSVVVSDQIDGGKGQPVHSRVLLHPECQIETGQDHRSDRIRFRRGSNHFELVSESPMEVAPAEWFPDFGVKMETQQLVLSYGNAPCRGTYELRAIDV